MMEKNRLSDKEFDYVFSKVPRICVDLVIKTEKGILLTKRAIDPYKGQWHIPGGSIFFKETVEEAAKRIAMDELGLSIEPIRFLGVTEYLKEGNQGRHSISIEILSRIISGTIKLNHQADSFVFSKTPPKNTIPEQEEFLKRSQLMS